MRRTRILFLLIVLSALLIVLVGQATRDDVVLTVEVPIPVPQKVTVEVTRIIEITRVVEVTPTVVSTPTPEAIILEESPEDLDDSSVKQAQSDLQDLKEFLERPANQFTFRLIFGFLNFLVGYRMLRNFFGWYRPEERKKAIFAGLVYSTLIATTMTVLFHLDAALMSAIGHIFGVSLGAIAMLTND